MSVPLILFVGSLLALFAAVLQPELSDFILVAGPAALASLYLLLRAMARRPPAALAPRDPGPPLEHIVVDGSNVMHWKDETPQLSTVREVLSYLRLHGYKPGIVFDANAGYKITGSYLHDHALGKLLGLPEEQVMVVPKGTPADPLVLAAARDLGARIVTNDRYREWADTHPEVRDAGHLVRGGYRDGQLWLGLDQGRPVAGSRHIPPSHPADSPL